MYIVIYAIRSGGNPHRTQHGAHAPRATAPEMTAQPTQRAPRTVGGPCCLHPADVPRMIPSQVRSSHVTSSSSQVL